MEGKEIPRTGGALGGMFGGAESDRMMETLGGLMAAALLRCTAAAKRAADLEASVLEALIDEREQLRPYVKRYEEAGDEIKRRLGERHKVEAGRYVVSVQTVDKPEYLVPARRERRIFVKRV